MGVPRTLASNWKIKASSGEQLATGPRRILVPGGQITESPTPRLSLWSGNWAVVQFCDGKR